MELQELVERINQWKTSQGAPPIAPIDAPAQIPEAAMAAPEITQEIEELEAVDDSLEMEAEIANDVVIEAKETIDQVETPSRYNDIVDEIEDADDNLEEELEVAAEEEELEVVAEEEELEVVAEEEELEVAAEEEELEVAAEEEELEVAAESEELIEEEIPVSDSTENIDELEVVEEDI